MPLAMDILEVIKNLNFILLVICQIIIIIDEEPIHENPFLSENPGPGSQGSIGHGKSGVSQGSGENGSQTNENIYENLSLPGNPGNATGLKEDAISHGHLGGN